MRLKLGELAILWTGGILSVVVLLQIDNSTIRAVAAVLIAIWIICALVWLTIYRRQSK